jgi:hypothetical protein
LTAGSAETMALCLSLGKMHVVEVTQTIHHLAAPSFIGVTPDVAA